MTLGTGAAWFFRQLKKDTVTSDTGLTTFVGSEAEVVLAVRPGSIGTIRVRTLSGTSEWSARTQDLEAIDRGESVIIVGVRDGVMSISRLAPRSGQGDATSDVQTSGAHRQKKTT
jgi:membrane protein implicated in regulation of membrane protease activity